MAYNSSKGPQQHGDIKFEGDPLETQVDFEDDFIALKTNGEQRFIVSGSFITSSIPISCSVGITASSFAGDGSGLLNLPAGTVSGSARVYSSTGLETSGYLKVTGSSTFTNIISGSSTLHIVSTISSTGDISTSGSFVIGAASMDETDLEKLDGITNGTVAVNKALVVDGSKNIGDLGVITAASITGSKGRFDLANGNLIVTGSIAATTTATLVDITGSKGRFDLANGNLLLTGTLDVGGTAQINNTLTLSGSSSEALRITKDDTSAREIVFENGGTDKAAIYLNSAENLFIRQEDGAKDINLRIASTNAVVVKGSASEVAFSYSTAHTNISSSGNLNVGGSVSASADVYVTGAVSASLFIGDGTGITGVSATNISGANGQFNTANGNLIVTGTIEMNGFVVDTDGDTNLKSLRVDDGSFIGCDSDTDLLRLSANVVQVNGTVSGSNNLQFSSASFNGDVSVSGTVRGRMIQLTNHAYNISGGGERWIPFYNLSDLNFTSHDWTGQIVTPFSGRLRRVIFRPGASDCGSTKITLYKQTDGTENMQSSRTYVEEQTVTCTAAAATSNVFNFTGSSHFSAGEVIGVAIDPTNGPDNANVTCVWEYDIFGV